MVAIIRFFSFLLCIIPVSLRAQKPVIYKTYKDHIEVYFDAKITSIYVYDRSVVRIFHSMKRPVVKSEFQAFPKPSCTGWSIEQKGAELIARTSKLKLLINNRGNVRFYSASGQPLLAELPASSALNHNMVKDGFQVEQAFSSGNECLFGLGQFQNGLMNWKNTPLTLKQFNQEIAIPHMLSTKGYSILWNNNSATTFNAPDDSLFFDRTIDADLNIRSAVFKPDQTGIYNFSVASPNKHGNRRSGPIMLKVDGKKVIYYNTVWVPENHSGRIFLVKGHKYNITFQNSNSESRGSVLYNKPDFGKSVFRSEVGNQTDYFFIYGGSPGACISLYRRLTGAAPLFSKSVFGFWQCRERYNSQAELLENAMGYRKREIPVDNIVQDWNYWPDSTWGPQWDRSRYPEPRIMCQTLEDNNFHFMVSVWPKLRNRQLEQRYHLDCSKIDSAGNLDFFDTAVQHNYYKMLSDSMFRLGVNSIWLDGTEPEEYPANAVTKAGTFEKNALVYSLLVTKSVYEGHRKEFPDQRVFNLTRSSFIGQQRYAAAVWSGDVAATWEQLREQIAGGLNFSAAGLPYWTSDIGGFFRDSTSLNSVYDNQYTNTDYKELLSRWFEFGAFCPLFRIHGYKSQTEVWRYGQNFEDVAKKYIALRYQLLPYIYSTAWEVTSQGGSFIKPLVHDYPSDKACWNISDEFLFGNAMLISPVTEPHAVSKEVYVPKGKWCNFWTGEAINGEKTTVVSSQLKQIPILVKSGAILPVGPEIQYAMQGPANETTLFVFPGTDGTFNLYDDEGESYNYEKGLYSIIPIRWDDNARKLTIGKRKGSYPNEQLTRKFAIVVINYSNGAVLNQPVNARISYYGESVEVNLK